VLDLHRVGANIFTENGASCRVLEKNGFRREGVRRKARYRSGAWHDEVLYGLLGEEAYARQ
jgi:RimJ/RimL family protein N-acetyltransferase